MITEELNTVDGSPIVTRIFNPSGPRRGQVILAPAMGTAQNYYQAFATWLSEQGFSVTTFDYRGMGESKTDHLKNYKVDILDWAQHDCSMVLQSVLQKRLDEPVYWIGHSLGGQIFPLVDDIDKVTKVITIASGTGYWRHNSPQLKRKVWWFWFFMVPALVKLYGYFPGKKVGMVGDLPKLVIQQWKKWCMHPEYCAGTETGDVRKRFDQINIPIRSLALSDDEMLSDKNIAGLFGLFGSQDKSLRTLEPAEFGVKRIGHLGFFRSEFSQNLWPKTMLPELVNS